MANSYHQLYVQTVFPVKYRDALIQPEWKAELRAVMSELLGETGCKTIIINGVEDHMHCFFGLRPSLSIAEVMKSVKAKSSKWINESGYLAHRFEWQAGYGCFSYSHSHVDKVYKYIKNQENHHRRMIFKEEYMRMLNMYEVDYDERYLFDDLI
jgi:REP element-mobilizing transposase RayT